MIILKFFSLFLPWKIKRIFLQKIFKFEIHPTAKIGFSWIFPKTLIMLQNSKINHFTVGIHLDKIFIEKNSYIGRGNWITGFPTDKKSKHFSHQINRRAELIIGRDSAITNNHHIDCTNRIQIGNFVTIAGYNSQLLTHSINTYENIQDSAPIIIGDYCFVSTNVVILGGAILPSFSVLGAKAMLSNPYNKSFFLYGGVPALPIKELSKDAKYFNRENGFVI